MKKTTIIVNQQPYHTEEIIINPEGIRAFANAPEDYEVWRIINAPDPEGQLPIDDEQITSSIEVASGDRFRVVPPGTFGSVQCLKLLKTK